MKKITLIAVLILTVTRAYAQIDTLDISSSYTTHVIFSTELTYADLSNNKVVAAKIIEQNRNMLAIKARLPFEEFTSVSALESNGTMHTFIVRYNCSPTELVIDRRSSLAQSRHDSTVRNSHSQRKRREDTPLLSELSAGKQRLYHLGDKKYGIMTLCENIITCNDITYIVLSLKNSSGVSYDINDATFVIESKRKGRRTVVFEKTIFPEGRHGSLSCHAGESAGMAYSFRKMTLSKDQVLKVYFYENGGQRNLELTIDTDDINKAGKI